MRTFSIKYAENKRRGEGSPNTLALVFEVKVAIDDMRGCIIMNKLNHEGSEQDQTAHTGISEKMKKVARASSTIKGANVNVFHLLIRSHVETRA